MKYLPFFIFSILSAQLISGNINWTFPPQTLSTSVVNASDPHVAMDANGNAVAVWIENEFVKSKSKLSSSSWGSTSTLSGTSSNFPLVAMDSNGNATAIWIQSAVVYASSKTLSGVWSTPVLLSGTNATHPTLAVDAAGDVVAAWARNGNIEVSIKLFAGHWQKHTVIENAGGNAAFPKVGVGGSGARQTAFLVWHSTTSPTATVWASSKPIASGSWSTATAISNSSSPSAYAHVAVDTNGNATAVWFSYNLTGSIYYSVAVEAATIPVGGSWGSPIALSEPGMRDPSTLTARVAYDAFGNAIAVWVISFDNETFSIQSSVKPTFGNWGQPTVLVPDNLYAFQTSLSLSSFGDALALSMFYNGTALQIQSAELDTTGFMASVWSVPITISSGIQNGNPSVAAILKGNVVNSAAVWLNSNGGVNSVVASTGSKTLVSPPSNLMVAQSANNFGVFIEYLNTLTWRASTDPSVVGYLIYRNGVFLSQVASNVVQFVDDNQVGNGPVTYGVASVDAQQSHSPIITVNFP